jgi:NAD-dependent SIR2 family protein deacetylase
MEQDEGVFVRAAALIRKADVLLITSGAGMGVDSGQGTFVGETAKDGWPPFVREEETPYSMAKARRMDEDPHLFWGCQYTRYLEYKQKHPHAGYYTVFEFALEKAVGLFTSNIDGHWLYALNALNLSYPLVEQHGSVHLMQCHVNCRNKLWSSDFAHNEYTVDSTTGKANDVPRCPDCNGYARFNVQLVADNHFNETRRAKQLLAWHSLLENANGKMVVVLELGAGVFVPTVRQMSGRLTKQLGATLIRINLDDPELFGPVDKGFLSTSNQHVSIASGAAAAIKQIFYFI